MNDEEKFSLLEIRQILFEYMIKVKKPTNSELLAFAGFLKTMHLNKYDSLEKIFEAINNVPIES